MAYDYDEHKKKQISSMRSIMDYGMGVLFLLIGVFFLFHKQFGYELDRFSRYPVLDIVFGAVCLLYGGWRIYRGYKKNYFK